MCEMRIPIASAAFDTASRPAPTPSTQRGTTTWNSPPAWRVTIDGHETITSFEPPHGFIRVRMPQGWHVLEARLEETGVERAADATTAASGWILVLLGVSGRRRWAEGVA